ncbi:hypothetical protein BJY59DRAFT_387692 [Rhodotorula toruloides]
MKYRNRKGVTGVSEKDEEQERSEVVWRPPSLVRLRGVRALAYCDPFQRDQVCGKARRAIVRTVEAAHPRSRLPLSRWDVLAHRRRQRRCVDVGCTLRPSGTPIEAVGDGERRLFRRVTFLTRHDSFTRASTWFTLCHVVSYSGAKRRPLGVTLECSLAPDDSKSASALLQASIWLRQLRD